MCAPPDDIMNHKRLCRVLRRLWFFHFHINLKSTEPRAACCRLPAAGRWCLAATGGMSQFMYFSESKPKFLSPNSFSTMAQITPTTVSLWKYKTRQRTDKKHLRYSVCIHIDVDVEEPGTSENPTRSFEIHNIGSHSFWP